MIAYLIAGIALVGALGGLYWKVDNGGYARGKGEIQVKWDAANAAAQKKADEDRTAQEALRATQDRQATRRLADARKSNQQLLQSLESHIKVARLPVDCKLTPELHSDVNRALAGPQGERTGAVPSQPGPPAPPR